VDSAIVIKPGEKVFGCAQTGAGKTVFFRHLLKGKAYTIVVDPKHEFSWSETGKSRYDHIYTNLSDLKSGWKGPTPAIYRPDISDLADGCNEFFKYCWGLKSVRVYIDELLDLCPTGRAGYWLAKCIKQGRSRGLSIWSGTQRPAGIPLELISESKHIFIGYLGLPQDRKRMAEASHPDVAKTIVPPFEFIYFGTVNRKPRKVSVDSVTVKGN
jgi:DNA helicase HerA-like ATPase